MINSCCSVSIAAVENDPQYCNECWEKGIPIDPKRLEKLLAGARFDEAEVGSYFLCGNALCQTLLFNKARGLSLSVKALDTLMRSARTKIHNRKQLFANTTHISA